MMLTRHNKPFLVAILAVLLGAVVAVPAIGGDGPAADPAPAAETDSAPPDADGMDATEPTIDQSNPRSTLAGFLNAMDEANQGAIERYVEALRCLDLSGLSELPENARNDRGRDLAVKLEGFIGGLIETRKLNTELISDQADGDPAVCFEYEGQPAVQMARDEGGVWRFTWDSLEFVDSDRAAPAETQPVTEQPAAEPVLAAPAPDVAVESSQPIVPSEYATARATMRTFLQAVKDQRIDDAAKCLDLSVFPLVIRDEQGRKLAEPLYETITRVKTVVLRDLPDTPDGTPHLFWHDRRGAIIALGRQGSGGDRPGWWVFTPNTVRWIDSVSTVPSALRPYVPDWALGKWFLLQHWQWEGMVVLLLASWVLYRMVMMLLGGVARVWFARKRVAVGDEVQRSSFRPAGILAASAVWWWGLAWIAPPPEVWAVLLFAVKVVTCWAAVWTAYRAADLLAGYVASLASKTHTRMDDMLVPFGRKVAKALVTILGIVFIVDQFTDETPFKLLAGLGLGGLALALAAQDTLKNLFGSATVLADGPFKVGDWVHVGDVDGTVESVGFRSTRIRTFYNSQVVVPNSTLMNAIIDNYGARQYRRANVTLSITYGTPPDKIDAFCEGVRELVRLHPYTRKDYYHVYLNKFGASSLDIMLYVFFEAPDWSTELRERHHLFVDILRLAGRLGVEFAFPTQTVWLERGHGNLGIESGTEVRGSEQAIQAGSNAAAAVFEEAYGPVPAVRPPVVVERVPRTRGGVS